MRTIFSLMLAGTLLILSGCANVVMNTESEAKAPQGLAAMKSFDLYQPRLGVRADPYDLRTMLKDELVRKGLTFDQSAPQLFVDARLNESDVSAMVPVRPMRPDADQIDTSGATVMTPEESRMMLVRTVFVGIYDAAKVRAGAPLSESILWSSNAASETPGDVIDLAPCLIKGALSTYPAGGSKYSLTLRLRDCPR